MAQRKSANHHGEGSTTAVTAARVLADVKDLPSETFNIKGAFMHMAADAGVSLGVVAADFAISRTGLYLIDPLTSLVIVAIIAVGTWGLLRDSSCLASQAVPPGIDANKMQECLAALPEVVSVHDLHIWPMSTTETALTAHLEMPNGNGGDEFLYQVCQHLHDDFKIEHCTIQVEQNAKACLRAPEENV